MTAQNVVAIDLGGTKIAAALVDSTGRIRRRSTEAVDTASANAVVEQIAAVCHRYEGAEAIGICIPGLVRRNGTVWAPNLPGWDAMPLAKTLQRKLRLPVFVESDRNAVVLGEAWRGAAKDRRDAIVLIVGTGIGAGIVSDGRLVRGAHELSGCAGWLVVTDEQNEDSRRCGSLEALAAGPAIARAFDDTTPAAAAAARNGDRRAVDIFHRAGRLLGKAVANLISLFDPEVIVLTGGMSNTADIWMDALQHAVAEHAQPLSAPKVRIAVSKLQTDANLLGAAKLALDGVRLSPAAAGSRPAAAGKRTKRTAARRPRAAGGDARNPKNSKRRKSSR